MFEVFDTVSGRTLAYVRTEGEATIYADGIAGSDYDIANEGYYIEVHSYGRSSSMMNVRCNNKRDATNAVDMLNQSSDTRTHTLVPCVAPIQ